MRREDTADNSVLFKLESAVNTHWLTSAHHSTGETFGLLTGWESGAQESDPKPKAGSLGLELAISLYDHQGEPCPAGYRLQHAHLAVGVDESGAQAAPTAPGVLRLPHQVSGGAMGAPSS